jgi:hypothetical protein
MTTQMHNVFISRPTVIAPDAEAAYSDFDAFLAANGIKRRRLGQTDYSREAPLKAIFRIIDECCGAIILGYPQFAIRHEALRSNEAQNVWGYVFPTPWNQIEGALAYRAKTPVLVIAHDGVDGGVFDHGVTGESVLHLDLTAADWFKKPQFKQPFDHWLADVATCSASRQRNLPESQSQAF